MHLNEVKMKKALNLINALWIYPLRGILIVLTHLLYRPKIYYESGISPRQSGLSLRRHIKQGSVLTCNHLRGCDGAVISVIFHRERIHSIVARYWYRKWYLYPLLRCGFSIPLDNRSIGWLRRSARAIRRGDSVLIFPEGRAVPGDKIYPFKPGFLMLAAKTGAQVLPLYMEGQYNRPFLKRLYIVVGTPYTPPPPPEREEVRQDYYRRQCDDLYQKTLALKAILAEKRQKKGRKEKK